MHGSSFHTLVCYAHYTDTLGYYDDWLDSFERAKAFRVTKLNLANDDARRAIAGKIATFDLIVLLHSTNADTLDYLRPFIQTLEGRRGRLLSFVGNELNMPWLGMRDKLEMLGQLEPDFVATQLPLEAGQYLYAHLKRSQVIEIPHALNPDRYAATVPQSDRTIDLGVRSYRYFPLIGDDERNRIIDYFSQSVFDPPLSVDISTAKNQRFTTEQWAAFLNRCRGTIATEAGTYYLERDDETVRQILEYIETKYHAPGQSAYAFVRRTIRKCTPPFLRRSLKSLVPSSALEENHAKLHTLEDAVTFEELYEHFFRDYDNPVSGKCISSRHFDAIGTKTAQIMFPGAFNGILKADVHYLSLDRDFSNCDDVLDRFRDQRYRETMVDEVYAYVRELHTYEHRLRALAETLGASSGVAV